ncbi:MAG: UDP-2,3-diacylglucosamine diphosphatase [Planctomycetes bacterium]|nr:UDP-2,3-diacylglucosamine diphosphatase [Planctomycetota bacterium]MCP4771608.1 UDP-2,3-diacylglucosamine diphosphatase [Planctomycetota bacterium]MCP4860092.1 UDP-2,3-diacylglucosamine diphosphatase [Planctomycetota bacterium]
MSANLAPYLAGEKALVVKAQNAAIFTDLHLHLDAPHEIIAFVQSLGHLSGKADALIILGDFFDVYIGREVFVHPYFEPFVRAVEYLAANNCPTYILRGNRDVMMNKRDGKLMGFAVADSILLETGAQKRVLLTHGDAFCLADLPYQKLRRTLRFPGLRRVLRTLPFWARKRIAQHMRGYSKQEVARKPLDSMALTLEQVQKTMSESRAELAVIGHLHAEARHQLGPNQQLWVLPAWEPGTPPRMVAEMLDETV